MIVDYVRVYEAATISATPPAIIPRSVVNAASFLGNIAPTGLATLYDESLADGTHTATVSGGSYLDSLTMTRFR